MEVVVVEEVVVVVVAVVAAAVTVGVAARHLELSNAEVVATLTQRRGELDLRLEIFGELPPTVARRRESGLLVLADRRQGRCRRAPAARRRLRRRLRDAGVGGGGDEPQRDPFRRVEGLRRRVLHAFPLDQDPGEPTQRHRRRRAQSLPVRDAHIALRIEQSIFVVDADALAFGREREQTAVDGVGAARRRRRRVDGRRRPRHVRRVGVDVLSGVGLEFHQEGRRPVERGAG